jgi:hypothetical protein
MEKKLTRGGVKKKLNNLYRGNMCKNTPIDTNFRRIRQRPLSDQVYYVETITEVVFTKTRNECFFLCKVKWVGYTTPTVEVYRFGLANEVGVENALKSWLGVKSNSSTTEFTAENLEKFAENKCTLLQWLEVPNLSKELLTYPVSLGRIHMRNYQK